jgi:histidinol dehydrogenase
VGLPGGGGPFDPAELAGELKSFAARKAALFPDLPLRDVCISGDGEPTLSPRFSEALAVIAEARGRAEAPYGAARFVLITNSTGFLSPSTARALSAAEAGQGLEIWAKLDAGTEAWYGRVDRGVTPFDRLVAGIRAFASKNKITIQTMFCALAPAVGAEPEAPPPREIEAWTALVADLLAEGARIEGVQIYTQARPSPLGLTRPLPDDFLASIARGAARRFGDASEKAPRVRAFGASGEIDLHGGSS